MKTPFLAITLSLLFLSTAFAAPSRLAWWREARFGMFIHYGPVSLTGGEISWSRANSNPKCPNHGETPIAVYDNLYKQFNPTNFNPDDWAGLARKTGMKYVVLTAKHCDGFLLWDSKVDSYNIMATPFNRDICAELAQAVRKQGLRLGWYFSPMDWRDPDFRSERNHLFLPRMQGELRELLSNYGTIDLLWFDFDGREAVYDQTNTYALLKRLQPQIIIDNRLDLSTGDNNTQLLSPFADYYTPEQQIGGYDDKHPWETCMTICEQWAWKPGDKLKTPAEVISILCRTVGGDGNLLLNVGPMPDGRIERRQVAVLEAVGAWMKINGESIYGTRGGPYKPTSSVSSTRKDKAVYVHVLSTGLNHLELPALSRKIKSASLLGGGKVDIASHEGKILLTLAATRDPLPAVIKLELDRSALDLPALDLPPP
jgi:alpha-L-fucosidase